jgi:predicted PurR-regulated permease PerM
MPEPNDVLPESSHIFSRVTGIVSSTLGAVANFLIVLVVGLYLAVEPHRYARGLVRLVPEGHRQRAREVVAELGRSLWWWLMGQIVSMTVVGVAVTLGLWLVGVPAPLALGVLAGLSEFVPTLGPLLASVPALLVGLAESPRVALYAAGVFLVVQTLESYLLMPLVNKRAVALRPAVTISAQLLMGVLVGGLGVLFATPLVLCATVLVKMLYLEDALGEDVTLPSESDSSS